MTKKHNFAAPAMIEKASTLDKIWKVLSKLNRVHFWSKLPELPESPERNALQSDYQILLYQYMKENPDVVELLSRFAKYGDISIPTLISLGTRAGVGKNERENDPEHHAANENNFLKHLNKSGWNREQHVSVKKIISAAKIHAAVKAYAKANNYKTYIERHGDEEYLNEMLFLEQNRDVLEKIAEFVHTDRKFNEETGEIIRSGCWPQSNPMLQDILNELKTNEINDIDVSANIAKDIKELDELEVEYKKNHTPEKFHRSKIVHQQRDGKPYYFTNFDAGEYITKENLRTEIQPGRIIRCIVDTNGSSGGFFAPGKYLIPTSPAVLPMPNPEHDQKRNKAFFDALKEIERAHNAKAQFLFIATYYGEAHEDATDHLQNCFDTLSAISFENSKKKKKTFDFGGALITAPMFPTYEDFQDYCNILATFDAYGMGDRFSCYRHTSEILMRDAAIWGKKGILGTPEDRIEAVHEFETFLDPFTEQETIMVLNANMGGYTLDYENTPGDTPYSGIPCHTINTQKKGISAITETMQKLANQRLQEINTEKTE